MPPEKVISFPQMGSYNPVFSQILSRLFPDARVLPPPPITQRTVELGARHSPDFICMPFKYNLGNYIEALERGANILLQTGTGCRYGYYGELQNQILRDLGYEFRFACFSRQRSKPRAVLSMLRSLGCGLPLPEVLSIFRTGLASIRLLDRYEYWMRENLAFEEKGGSCEALRRELMERIEKARSAGQIRAAKNECRARIMEIPLKKPENPLRVGIVGELYTLMEPFSNFDLEKQLAEEGISVSRAMSIWFLLFGKRNARSLKESRGYLRFLVGANGVDSVSQAAEYARRGYDGVLHIKSFGCIPELNATPALMALSAGEEIPILHLSFDAHTAQAGVRTRIEAFADMIRMRKEAQDGQGVEHGNGYRFRFGQGGYS